MRAQAVEIQPYTLSPELRSEGGVNSGPPCLSSTIRSLKWPYYISLNVNQLSTETKRGRLTRPQIPFLLLWIIETALWILETFVSLWILETFVSLWILETALWISETFFLLWISETFIFHSGF